MIQNIGCAEGSHSRDDMVSLSLSPTPTQAPMTVGGAQMKVGGAPASTDTNTNACTTNITNRSHALGWGVRSSAPNDMAMFLAMKQSKLEILQVAALPSMVIYKPCSC